MTSEESLGSTGPFLIAAVICEKVLQERDGVASVIRVIDRLTHAIQAPEMPAELPKVSFQFFIFVSLKAGSARGRHQLEVVSEHPSGQRRMLLATSILFEGEDRGSNVVAQTAFDFDSEGLYWFDVMVDGKRMTRIPFRMLYQLVSTGTR
jgi:hypothetical protein